MAVGLMGELMAHTRTHTHKHRPCETHHTTWALNVKLSSYGWRKTVCLYKGEGVGVCVCVCAYALADYDCVCVCVCVCVLWVYTHFFDILYELSGGGWLVIAQAAVIGIMSVSLLSVIINTV